MKPLETSQEMVTVEQDSNEDGTPARAERRREPRHDLRFVHARHDGVIWFKAMALTRRQSARDLPLFVADLARDLNGGRVTVSIHPRDGIKMTGESRRAVVTESLRGRLAEHDAASGRIDFGESLTAPTFRLRITVVRFEFLEPLPAYQTSSPWPVVQRGYEPCARRAALLFVGYFNDVEHFAEGQADYVELLRQIRLDGQQGAFEPLPTAAPTPAPVGSTL